MSRSALHPGAVHRPWWLAVAVSLTALSIAWAAAPPGPDFSRDIRPILSDNCFACHGPDEQARKAKFRLDVKADALKPLRGGDHAIVPGEPDRSKLLALVATADEDDVMPPPKTGKRLTPVQVDALRQWIAAGADWPEHWAFVKPQRPAVPEPAKPGWVRNPIDALVLERLGAEGLEPAPEADRPTLIRRATLDLTGLPPTIEEVDAFLADERPEAYEALVDRLLASPRYGEHLARYWLDTVRYADSHGYHIDSQRDIWAYRQWVIQAFNRNEPFDRFTVEQFAGDLLPSPTLEQKIATGFVRCNMSTGEGGVIEDEYRAKYMFDRVETMGAAYMGLTLICARCHTHKYDPILQREYYGLYAFFNQLDEPVMDGNRPNPDPFIKVPSQAQAERLDWLNQHIDVARKQVEAPVPELDAAQAAWAGAWHARLAAGWTPLAPLTAASATTNGPTLQVLEDQSVLATGPNPETDTHELRLRTPPGRLGALRVEALADASLPRQSSGRAEDGRFWLSEIEADLVGPSDSGARPKPVRLKFAQAWANAAIPEREACRAIDGNPGTGWQPTADAATTPHAALFALGAPVDVAPDSELVVRLVYRADQAGRAIGRVRLSAVHEGPLFEALFPPRFMPWQMIGPLPASSPTEALAAAHEIEQRPDFAKRYPGVREEVGWAPADFADGRAHQLVQDLHGVHGIRYLHRTITLPAARPIGISLRVDGLFKLWVNGELVGTRDHEPAPGEGPLKLTVNLAAGENRLLLKLVTIQGASHFAFNPDFGSPDALVPDVAGRLALAAAPSGADAAVVRDYYRRQHSEAFRQVIDDLAAWRQELEALDRAIPTTLVAKESAKPIETRLLLRGEYDKPGEVVTAHLPGILPPLPAGAPTNRLGLARWLVDPDHPLTARVTVNRLWQQCFGIGLVKTTEDFGVQGERPSHPALLDWLATEFVRSGWDTKHMLRLMVTSATYRQSSALTPALVARDPENRLLARGPRFRVDGEVVRDSALAVSGLLVERQGGPSVRPYEPPGLWEAVSFNNSQKYVQDRGEGNYRRSLYTYWKRQSPPPNMLLFDAPTREVCAVRRPRTNTPLQALALLNDPQFVEASRALARRMLLEGGDRTDTRLALGFRLATSRPPTREELDILASVLQQQLEDFRAHTTDAQRLLAVGATPPAGGLDPGEWAAWTTVASILLNLDEAVTKG